MRHELPQAPALRRTLRERPRRLAPRGRRRGRRGAAGRMASAGRGRVRSGAATGPDAPLVVLENSSGGGDSPSASRSRSWRPSARRAAARGLDGRLAFCLDTAHLWGAGYDISSPAAIDDVLATFDRLLGLGRLAMIHLNDYAVRPGLAPRSSRPPRRGPDRPRAAMAHLLRHPAPGPRGLLSRDAANGGRLRRGQRGQSLADLAAGRPLTRDLRPVPRQLAPAAGDTARRTIGDWILAGNSLEGRAQRGPKTRRSGSCLSTDVCLEPGPEVP